MNQYALWNKNTQNWAGGSLCKTLRSSIESCISLLNQYKRINSNMQYCVIRLSDNRIMMEL